MVAFALSIRFQLTLLDFEQYDFIVCCFNYKVSISLRKTPIDILIERKVENVQRDLSNAATSRTEHCQGGSGRRHRSSRKGNDARHASKRVAANSIESKSPNVHSCFH